MTVLCQFLVTLTNLKIVIKDPTCYKNPSKSSCIDLLLTNKPRSFKHSCVIETVLSDFQRMTVTLMKATSAKSSKL